MASFLCKANSALAKAGWRPLTKNNVMFHYAPLKGCVAYSALSIQVFNPELFQNFKFMFVPRHISLTNACLLNSLTGMCLYLYSRPHLAQASTRDRMIFCGFGSLMFNLGSMLLWALGRTVAPESPLLRTLVGAAGAAGALHLGRSYVLYLDSLVKDREE